MANRYVAGASGLPFAVLRGYVGTDLPAHTANIAADHLPVHRRGAHRGAGAQPGRRGRPRPAGRPARATCRCGASPACRRRRCSPPGARWSRSRRSSTSWNRGPARWCCRPGRSPRWRWCPRGAHPSYAQGYYDRDNDYYQAWDAISRDRDTFTAWLERTCTSLGAGERADERRSLTAWTADEMMTVAAARALAGRTACFVGIGLPSTAANLARRLHNPDLALVYESGTHRRQADRAATVHRRR